MHAYLEFNVNVIYTIGNYLNPQLSNCADAKISI